MVEDLEGKHPNARTDLSPRVGSVWPNCDIRCSPRGLRERLCPAFWCKSIYFHHFSYVIGGIFCRYCNLNPILRIRTLIKIRKWRRFLNQLRRWHGYVRRLHHGWGVVHRRDKTLSSPYFLRRRHGGLRDLKHLDVPSVRLRSKEASLSQHKLPAVSYWSRLSSH